MPRTSTKSKPKSAAGAKPQADIATASPIVTPTVRGPTLRQLAHELNSLLDGSMRCVGLARTSLQKQHTSSTDAADNGLSKAHTAMRHMAALLERAMKQPAAESPSATFATFNSQQSIGDLATELEGLLQPHAQQCQATMTFCIDAECSTIKSGPLGTILMNGLRNALQACEASNPNVKREVTMNVSCDKSSLDVSITGPHAVKPVGHRIGMGLSEQIVTELGGEMAFTSANQVCTLRIRVPIASLTSHA